MLARIRTWARSVKHDIAALWLAVRDSRTPVLAKYLAAVIVAYALSPVDLIPDFIPVLGWLDDLIIVPLGILALKRLMPGDLMIEMRERAKSLDRLPRSHAGLLMIALIWIASLAAIIWWMRHNH